MRTFLVGLLTGLLCISSAHAFTIGLPESTQNTDYQPQLERVFTELYRDISEQIQFAYLPFSRMLLMIEKHQLDAVVYQMGSATQTSTYLLQVPEPLTQISLFAGCKTEADCLPTDRSRFVVVSDSLYANQWCQSRSLSCLSVANPDLARKALLDGLADIHLMQRMRHITESCLSEQRTKVRPILNTSIDVHHYVAKQHQALIAQLSEKIKQMKQSFVERQSHCNDVALNVKYQH